MLSISKVALLFFLINRIMNYGKCFAIKNTILHSPFDQHKRLLRGQSGRQIRNLHAVSPNKTTALLSWNATSNTCIPDVCNGARLPEILSFDNNLPVALAELNFLFDTKRTRECFKNKHIVFLGDSTTTETIADLFILLSGFAGRAEKVRNYIAASIASAQAWKTGKEGEFVQPAEILPDNTTTIALTQMWYKNMRNASIFVPDLNISIRDRFNGGGVALQGNGAGILGMFSAEIKDEFDCLLGTVESGCRRPDLLVYQSAHHDSMYIVNKGGVRGEFEKHIGPLMTKLRAAKDRGTQVYWRSSFEPKQKEVDILHSLNHIAEKEAKRQNIRFINMTEGVLEFAQHVANVTQRYRTDVLPHIGILAGAKVKDMMYSTYMTQQLLANIC